MAFGELPVLTVPNSADGPQGTGPARDLHWLDEQWPLRTDRPVGTGGGGDIWQLWIGARMTGAFIPIIQSGPKRELVPVS